MKKVEVVNIYKHNIVYRNIKKINSKNLVASIAICLTIILSFCYMYNINNKVQDSIKVFNPISELYRNVETASFVNNIGSINFIAPIKTENYKINSHSIEFVVEDSCVVCSPERGVVCEIGNYNNASKYIKLQHSNNLFSIIKNINVVGVKEGYNVKQGEVIATVKEKEIIIFEIEVDKKVVGNLYFNKRFIKWK